MNNAKNDGTYVLSLIFENARQRQVTIAAARECTAGYYHITPEGTGRLPEPADSDHMSDVPWHAPKTKKAVE